MSKKHVLQYIRDHMSPSDLIERLEPYITTEQLIELLEDVIDSNFSEAFEEELEDYYE